MVRQTHRRRDYRLIVLVNAIFFAGVGVSAPLETLYLEELGANYATIAWVLASNVGVMLFAGYAWGWLSDRLGKRKPLLVIGLVILAVAYGWIYQAQSVAGVWAARLLAGAGLAAFVAISLAMVGDLIDQVVGKGRTMGWFRGLGSLAFAMGAIAGGRIADSSSLAASMGVCGLLFALAALFALPLHDYVVVPKMEDKRSNDRAIQNRAPSLPAPFLLGVMFWMAAHAGSTSVWPNYMATFGYSNSTISGLWGIAALVETPSMIVAGLLSDHIGRIAVLASGGLAIAGVQIGYLLAVQMLPLLLGVQLLRGYGFGSYTVAAMTFAAEFGPATRRGADSGLFNTAGSVGQLLGMFLGGTIAQIWGFPLMYGLCAALATGSALCFLLMYHQQTQTGEHYEQTG